MNQNIQLYTSAKDNKGKLITVQEVIETILGTSQKGKGLITVTREYRALVPGKVKDDVKKTFPAVAWSGTFTKRAATSLSQHSGLICLDIDKVGADKLEILQAEFKQDPNIFFFFISPSGNGIKVLFKIDADGTTHIQYFNALQLYFKQHYNTDIDTSGKDVSRLCFLCNDPNAYTNANSNILTATFLQQYAPQATKEKPLTKQQQTKLTSAAGLNEVWEFTQEMQPFTSGNRNACIYKFGINAALRAFDEKDTLQFAHGLAEADFTTEEIATTINSAYKKINNENQFGKFAKGTKVSKEITENRTSQTSKKAYSGKSGIEFSNNNNVQSVSGKQPDNNSRNGNNNDSNWSMDKGEGTYTKFWKEQLNEKTGKTTLALSYNDFFAFLEEQGFYNLGLDQQNVELIKLNGNIVAPVLINKTRNDVKAYLNRFCNDHSIRSVLEMLHRGEDKYFNRSKFTNLNFKNLEFLKDTAATSYYFHKNCVVEVTKDGIRTRDYEQGEKCLWQSQIINRDFHRVETTYHYKESGHLDYTKLNCEFARYQALASSNPNRTEVDAKTANHRFYAHQTAFGYLVNGYKHGTDKAIVAVDHQKAIDRSEQNGRTGKGLFAKAIGHIKKRYPVDGRRFDPKDNSMFEGVTMDVKIITVCDCHPNVDFGFFFNMITEDFTFRKLYVGPVTIPFKDSPKLYLDTNFSFKGDGASYRGRQHIIEFDNYFNEHHSPEQEFGHLMFNDWDEAQWNLFYNYAYECDQLFKSKGLIEYPGGNYYERKLMSECPEEFIDWCDRCDNGVYVNLPRNKRSQKKELFSKWCEVAKEWQLGNQTAHRFKKMVTQYCKTKGLQLHSKKPGGVEIYFIEDKNDPHYAVAPGEMF